jgi:nucleotide-binding universal stress UspA family protein
MTRTQPTAIVVGVDFTPASDVALEQALRRAADGASEVHAVHVVDDVEAAFGQGATEVERHDDLLRKLPSTIWAHIELLGRRVFPPLPATPIHVHVRLGRPAECLTQIAVDYDAGLIVVGTHGRKGFDKFILGSVAEDLVRNARCSVLVARPTRYEDVPKTERPDAPRPGEDLSRRLEVRGPHTYYSTEIYSWATRDVDVLGPAAD